MTYLFTPLTLRHVPPGKPGTSQTSQPRTGINVTRHQETRTSNPVLRASLHKYKYTVSPHRIITVLLVHLHIAQYRPCRPVSMHRRTVLDTTA